MMDEVFRTLVFWAIYWLIVLPAFLIIATPFVLVTATFSAPPYLGHSREIL